MVSKLDNKLKNNYSNNFLTKKLYQKKIIIRPNAAKYIK